MLLQNRLYTDDESDVEFREIYNKADGAVKRERALKFAQRIKEERAKRERE